MHTDLYLDIYKWNIIFNLFNYGAFSSVLSFFTSTNFTLDTLLHDL